MEPASEANQPQQTPQTPPPTIETQRLDRMITALQKTNQLMERHLASGEKTVPARALYFILRDAGFGNTQQQQTQNIKQTPKIDQEVTNQLNHSYGLRR